LHEHAPSEVEAEKLLELLGHEFEMLFAETRRDVEPESVAHDPAGVREIARDAMLDP
jgi:hypothetical protein